MAVVLISCALPVDAHKTEVSGDIAGTWHIEPNHNPKAGEPAQVWIALTRSGGTIIPLEQCNCRLEVRSNPPLNDTAPVLKPSLSAISAERYRGIPGAEVVFPKTGQYELRLIGTPKTGANFQPFEFTHTVIVTVGTAASPVNPSSRTAGNQPGVVKNENHSSIPSSNQSMIQGRVLAVGLLLVAGLGVLGLIVRQLKLGSR